MTLALCQQPTLVGRATHRSFESLKKGKTANVAVQRVHKRRKALSDAELAERLAQYAPLTDADFPDVSAEGYASFAKNRSGRITKGLEKWL